MSVKNLLSLFLVTSLSQRSASSVSLCSISPDVTYPGLYVDCRHKGFTAIPEDFPANATSIDLSRNNIETVTNYSFSTVNNLLFLNLEDNSIREVTSLAFDHCQNLEVLLLQRNSKCYQGDVFDDLTSLKSLTVDGCYSGGIFKNLKSLEQIEVTVHGNLSVSGFQYLKRLKNIAIHGSTEFQNNTFTDLINLNIEKLCINAAVWSLEAGTFFPLKQLKELSVINTNTGLKKTLASLYGLIGRNLTFLEIARVSFHGYFYDVNSIEDNILESESIRYLLKICIRRLVLSYNKILYINITAIEQSLLGSCLTHLDISQNSLTHHPVRTLFFLPLLSDLKYFDISAQDRTLPRPSFTSSCSLNKAEVRKTDVIANTSSLLRPDREMIITLPPSLEVINMSTYLTTSGDVEVKIKFRQAKNLLIFDLSYIGLGHINKLFGLVNLRYIDLSGSADLHLPDTFFDEMSSIETLKLNDQSLSQDNLDRQGKRFLKPLSRLTVLHISGNGLVVLPFNLFDSNPNLQYLDLSKNSFISLPIDLLLTPHLQVLDMASNSLGSLDKNTQIKIDNHYVRSNYTFVFILNQNFFSCSCGNFAFLFWLDETNLFSLKNKNFSCLTQTGKITYTGKINHNFIQFWRECSGETLLSVSGLFLTSMMFTVLVALLLATNKTKLANVFINILRYQIPKPKREDFRRDIYVSYAEADYQWVCHELCPALEERNLTLYIWDRDSMPGDSIPDQIAENIPQCWRTIIYFTNNYETDPWSYMSMMVAINCVDNLNPERLLLLLPEGEHLQIPDCLLEVVPESCIIHVSVDGRRNYQVWNEISRMIRADP